MHEHAVDLYDKRHLDNFVVWPPIDDVRFFDRLKYQAPDCDFQMQMCTDCWPKKLPFDGTMIDCSLLHLETVRKCMSHYSTVGLSGVQVAYYLSRGDLPLRTTLL